MALNEKVVETLKIALASNINTEQLSLDSMHMTDLVPFMDMLAQFQNLKSLILSDNRLRQLPMDMSCLGSLQNLDISNNLLSDIDLAVESLKTIPNLRMLKFPVKKDKEGIILHNLKNLVIFNDLKINKQGPKKLIPTKQNKNDELAIFKNQMIEQFQRIQSFEQNSIPNEEEEQNFISEVNQIINNSMDALAQREGEMSHSLETIYFNKTKFQIFDKVKDKCISIMEEYGDLGQVMRDVFDGQAILFENVLNQAIKLVQFEFEVHQNKNEQKIGGHQPDRKTAQKNDLLEKEVRRLKKKIQELTIQKNEIESQNKSYLQSIFRFAKGDKSGFSSINQNLTQFASRPNVTQSISSNFNTNQTQKSAERTSRPTNLSKQIIPNNYMSKGSKSMTLKQLKDVIQQIYEGKVKFDKKNFDGKIPMETMHQYLFTHLNKKYGLKNLTIDTASSIVEGIQRYSFEDNDVAVFGKILKNQVDEEFRNTQTELKTRIMQLIKLNIKSRVRNKSATQVQNLFRQKLSNGILSNEVEDIINYLYNKDDADRLLHKLEMHYQVNRPKEETSHRRLRDDGNQPQKDKKKIDFAVMLQVVLNFQLKYHERFLRPIVIEFKQKDQDQDGIVNEDQFIAVIQEICQDASELIPQMLMTVDPYENKVITFSQMARLVQNYPESNPILNRLIQKENDPLEDLE